MVSENGANGHVENIGETTLSVEAKHTLPGETFPVKQNDQSAEAPSTTDSGPTFSTGPLINGRQTTLGLYEPHHLLNNPIMVPLRTMINEAYRLQEGTGVNRILPGTQVRLPHENAFFDSVGQDPGTFTYILTYADEPTTVLATGSSHRYVMPVIETMQNPTKAQLTFGRFEASPAHAGAELWELKVLATDPGLWKQGLATYMMGCAERETRRRFLLAGGGEGEGERKRLVMLLSSIREVNSPFYLKRGYMSDYATKHEIGVLGSPTGFHVEHFSKVLVE